MNQVCLMLAGTICPLEITHGSVDLMDQGQLQTGTSSGCVISLYVQVISLAAGYGYIIHFLGDDIDDCSGECLNNMVVFAFDVSSVCGELRDVGKISLLLT